LLQGSDRIMPEIDPKLAGYGARVLTKRRGAEIRTNAHVRAIEPGRVHLADETIEADTIVLAAGTVPSPVVAGLSVEKDNRGHIVVDGSMRCQSHPEVWALGDCASIPASNGSWYPNLAQHALREAKVLAGNVFSALSGQPPQPFVYHTLGMMGSLGHSRGFGQLLKMRLHGVPAWFLRRTYYLLQMPGWGRRLRIMIDWTYALLFRPDIVKISLDSETALLLREVVSTDLGVHKRRDGQSAPAEPILADAPEGKP
jgi:NADH dehydrogenase